MRKGNARILVIGAGVNGSVCAVGLYRAGFDVRILARGKRYEDVQSKGIIIEDPLKHTRSVTKVPAISALDPQDCYDYVLVVVRKSQVADLLQTLACNQSPNVVFMTNNIAGPDEYIRALGRDRVMLGFVFAGGRREGDTIRAIRGGGLGTPFGEVDGTITPRLTRLVGILRQAGFKSYASTHLPDWLATHAVGAALFAALTIRHSCDTYALARSTADLQLLAAAMRESNDVLRAAGYRVTPWSTAVMGIIPRFILVMGFRVLFSSRIGEIGLGWHCSQAPDEMQQLAEELGILAEKSGLPAPAIRKALALTS